MYFFSLTIVGEEEVARDVVGEVFSKVWDDYDLLDQRNMKSYLMTSVRNRCIDYIRKQQRRGIQTDIDHLTKEIDTLQWNNSSDEREQTLQQLEKAILQLPELTQQVLKLCYYKHMKHAEAAETLDITPRMVKRHISNALSKLREYYGVQKKKSTL